MHRKAKLIGVLLASFIVLAGFSKPIKDTNLTDTYMYCPDTTLNKIYYATGNSYNIHDKIYMYDTTTKETVVALSPSKEGAWDDYHVCDPSVLGYKSTFNASKKRSKYEYNYIMAYLGSGDETNQNNRIGIAVSKDGKKWKKITTDECLPLGDATGWGIGQPSLFQFYYTDDASNEIKNTFYLFYTIENANDSNYAKYKTWYRECDFHNLNNLKMSEPKPVSTSGLDIPLIQNADFAVDDLNDNNGKYIYMVCDDTSTFTHTFNDGIVEKDVYYPTPDTSIIYRTTDRDFSTAKWTKFNVISPETPNGHNRNHNCGFVTNDYSTLDGLNILVSGSDNCLAFEQIEAYKVDPKDTDNTSFHNVVDTYRIYKYHMKKDL